MKQGNQFYLNVSIKDKNGNALNVGSVEKIQFNIDNIIKIYSDDSEDVTYNNDTKQFNVWLTEEETFNFKESAKMDIRVLFDDDTILGTPVQNIYFYNSLNKTSIVEEGEE